MNVWIIFAIWHQTSYICNMQCNAQNAKCWLLPAANYGHCYAVPT